MLTDLLVSPHTDVMFFYSQFTQYETVNHLMSRFFETGIRSHLIDVTYLRMREELLVSRLGKIRQEEDMVLAMELEKRYLSLWYSKMSSDENL